MSRRRFTHECWLTIISPERSLIYSFPCQLHSLPPARQRFWPIWHQENTNTLLQETLRLFRLPEVLHITPAISSKGKSSAPSPIQWDGDETWDALNSLCLQHKEDLSQIEEEMPKNVIIKCLSHSGIIYAHKELRINKSLGLLLQAWVLNFPSQNFTPKNRAQCPAGNENSLGWRNVCPQKGSRIVHRDTQRKEGMP